MKIPDNAQRVFKGIIFDVYRWQQEMYDGTKQTFEMLKRANTIEVIATDGEKILLSHQSQPNKADFYSLFGGRAEEGEAPLETAKRELLEEAGLESDDWELFKVYEPVHKLDWQIHTYIARNCQKVAEQSLDAGEKIEQIELDFEGFVELVTSDKYWGNELALDVLRMKLDNRKMNAFKQQLFGR